MAKVKYYYDSENLAYRKIKPKKGRRLGFILLFLAASGLFGFLCFVALINTPFFETPKDRLQAREIESMKLQTTIAAWRDGVVEAIHVAAGASFDRGAALATLAPES